MIRAFLVDDEALALKRLGRMLRETGRVEIAGMSSAPEEAVTLIGTSAVDVLFMDIEMPGCNGFELLNRLAEKPAVVFTTAYDRYAVKAFEANGTDYLLKPVTAEALDRALTKIEKSKAADPAEYRSMLEKLAAALGQAGRQFPRRIASKIGDRVQFVELENVTYFFAEGKLTYACTEAKKFIVDESIVQLEAKLDPAQFVRIHRGYMVNTSAVAEVCTWFGGKVIARLKDAARTELPVARDRARVFRERLSIG